MRDIVITMVTVPNMVLVSVMMVMMESNVKFQISHMCSSLSFS